MRSQLGIGVLGVAVAFLLVTNPVVVNAAGQIGSSGIKNNSVKSQDIRNNQVRGVDVRDGSLTAADLAAGTVPVEVKAVKRILADLNDFVLPVAVSPYIVGPVASVTVDASDTVDASISVNIDNATAGDQVDIGVCVVPQGSVVPLPLGGAQALFDSVDLANGDNLLTVQGTDILPAGTHQIGLCFAPPSVGKTAENVVGSVVVYNGSGPLAKVSASKTAPGDD